jgi:hypothetical protein
LYGVCDSALPATFFAAGEVLGVLNNLLAVEAAFLPVCFGFVAMGKIIKK